MPYQFLYREFNLVTYLIGIICILSMCYNFLKGKVVLCEITFLIFIDTKAESGISLEQQFTFS